MLLPLVAEESVTIDELSARPRANGQDNHGGFNGADSHWIDGGDPPPRFTFVYPPDLELRPREWLIPGLLPRRGFGILFGPSGCGKSFLAIDLALAIATRGEFLDMPVKQGGVVYVAAEDAEGVAFRVAAWFKSSGSNMDVPFAIVSQSPDLWSGDGDVELLIAAISKEVCVLRDKGADPALIILDTMRDVTPGMNENGSDEMAIAIRRFRRIAEEIGALVLVIHHTGKSGDGEDPRGSSALIGAADVALGAKIDTDSGGSVHRVIWVRKQRNAPDAKRDASLRWGYRLKKVGLGMWNEEGEEETSCIVSICDAPTPTAKSRKLSNSAVIVKRAVAALLSEGKGERPPSDVPCPPDQRAVRVEAAREQARALGISSANSKDVIEATRKAFARGKEQLIAEHQLYEKDGWLFLPKR
ncbi:MAG: AAA family ATPase [Hyphomonadaceae bacterium]